MTRSMTALLAKKMPIIDEKRPVKRTIGMTTRSMKKKIYINEDANMIETYYIDKRFRKENYFDMSQVDKNLKNRREIRANREQEGW